jgi:hypothetical protein
MYTTAAGMNEVFLDNFKLFQLLSRPAGLPGSMEASCTSQAAAKILTMLFKGKCSGAD